MFIQLEVLLLLRLLFLFNIIKALQASNEPHFSKADHEQELLNKLMKKYMKKQKPDGTVQIKFAMNLNQIVSVKAKDQEIQLNAFIDHEYIDNRMAWGMLFSKPNNHIYIKYYNFYVRS
jgi:hypothetical protein